MDTTGLLAQLRANARRIAALAQDLPAEQVAWKPRPQDWSILEVVCHLYDEERLDFRLHLKQVLFLPGEPWAPIDPPGWVSEHGYLQWSLDDTLSEFLAEREASLAWLAGLKDPDWQASRQTPWGSISAGDLLASWAAHDTLHLRQFVELHHAWTLGLSAPYDTRYAGEW